MLLNLRLLARYVNKFCLLIKTMGWISYASIFVICSLCAASATAEENTTVVQNEVNSTRGNESNTGPSTEFNVVYSTGNDTHPINDSSSNAQRPSRRQRRKELFDRMVKELAEHDPAKIEQLTTAPDTFYRVMNQCFMSCYDTFMRFCRLSFMGGGVKYFKLLISIACEADWLNAEKIRSIVKQTCRPRFFGRNY